MAAMSPDSGAVRVLTCSVVRNCLCCGWPGVETAVASSCSVRRLRGLATSTTDTISVGGVGAVADQPDLASGGCGMTTVTAAAEAAMIMVHTTSCSTPPIRCGCSAQIERARERTRLGPRGTSEHRDRNNRASERARGIDGK